MEYHKRWASVSDMSLKYETCSYPRQEKRFLKYQRYGIVHRLNRPAAVWNDGDMMWREYGESHRIDGPAVIWYDGDVEYFIRGNKYNKEDYESEIRN